MGATGVNRIPMVAEARTSRVAVDAGLAGLQALERHVLAVRTTSMSGRLHVHCSDRSIAVAGDDAWLITSRGVDFVANIHARAEEARRAECSG